MRETIVRKGKTYGASEGVAGSDGGGGRLISVGGVAVIVNGFRCFLELRSLGFGVQVD
jgi:hypothetical protein